MAACRVVIERSYMLGMDCSWPHLLYTILQAHFIVDEFKFFTCPHNFVYLASMFKTVIEKLRKINIKWLYCVQLCIFWDFSTFGIFIWMNTVERNKEEYYALRAVDLYIVDDTINFL